MNRFCIIILVLIFAGCGVEDSPPVGDYDYAANYLLPGVRDSMSFVGILRITSAASDELEGRWDVTRVQPELITGDHVEGMYELLATPTFGGTLVHRVNFGDSEISCTGKYVWVAAGGQERSVPLHCTLSYDEAPSNSPDP